MRTRVFGHPDVRTLADSSRTLALDDTSSAPSTTAKTPSAPTSPKGRAAYVARSYPGVAVCRITGPSRPRGYGGVGVGAVLSDMDGGVDAASSTGGGAR
jgi:hypothetical protein